jgi:hypothetical protein
VEGNHITIHERILLAASNAEAGNRDPNAILLGHKEWKELEDYANESMKLFQDGEEVQVHITLNSKSLFRGMRLFHLDEEEALFVATVYWPVRPPAHFTLDRQYGSHLP